MLSMISYAEERGEKRGEKKGEKKGIKKGENRLGMLMKILLDNKRYADAKRASEADFCTKYSTTSSAYGRYPRMFCPRKSI